MFLEKLTAELSEPKDDGALDTIAETDTEEHDDEISDGITAPITDDTATEDETVDNTQGSDDEGNFINCSQIVIILQFSI